MGADHPLPMLNKCFFAIRGYRPTRDWRKRHTPRLNCSRLNVHGQVTCNLGNPVNICLTGF